MRGFYQSGEYANGLVVTDARTLRSRPRSFWAGLLAQLSTDNVRVRAESRHRRDACTAAS